MEHKNVFSSAMSKASRPLLYVMLASLALRIAIPLLDYQVGGLKGFPTENLADGSDDAAQYITGAISLIENGTFSRNGVPDIVRTPGYPLFLVPGLISDHLLLVTVSLQIIISCLTVYLIFKSTNAIFDSTRAGIYACTLFALEPLSILHVGLIATETLFVFLVTLSLYFFVKHSIQGNVFSILASSGSLAAAIYVRPAAYFLPIILLSLLLVSAFRKTKRRSLLLRHATIFFICSVAFLGIWQFRNYIRTGYSGFSAITDMNAYFYIGAAILGEKKGISGGSQKVLMGWEDPQLYFSLHPEQRFWTEADLWEWRRSEALRIITDDPLIFFRLTAKGIVYTMFEPGVKWGYALIFPGAFSGASITQSSSQSRVGEVLYHFTSLSICKDPPLILWGSIVLFGLLITYFVLFAVGLVMCHPERRFAIVMLIITAAYFLIIPFNIGYSRFRLPAMPMICILAGWGLFILEHRIFGRQYSEKRGNEGSIDNLLS